MIYRQKEVISNMPDFIKAGSRKARRNDTDLERKRQSRKPKT